MKKPTAPTEPIKPVLSSRIRLSPQQIELTVRNPSLYAEIVYLTDVIDKIPETIPLSEVQICSRGHYDPYTGLSNLTCYLQYYIEEEDPNYENILKEFQAKSKEYETKMKSFETKMEKFIKDQEEYDKLSAAKVKK